MEANLDHHHDILSHLDGILDLMEANLDHLNDVLFFEHVKNLLAAAQRYGEQTELVQGGKSMIGAHKIAETELLEAAREFAKLGRITK